MINVNFSLKEESKENNEYYEDKLIRMVQEDIQKYGMKSAAKKRNYKWSWKNKDKKNEDEEP